MWVKICGNTNLDDAVMSVELGADAVGFVFAPSLRHVTAPQVGLITPHLPASVERVGVFPAWDAEEIAEAVQRAGLTAVQLHAAYDPLLVGLLRQMLEPQTAILQALHWEVGQHGNATALEQQLKTIAASGEVDRILIDSKVGEATGGTGVPFDWSVAQSLFASHPRLILAGGLRPHNVVEAVVQLQPWGIDVSSGVEESVGRKDGGKVAELIKNARLAVIRTQPS